MKILLNLFVGVVVGFILVFTPMYLLTRWWDYISSMKLTLYLDFSLSIVVPLAVIIGVAFAIDTHNKEKGK